MEGDGDAVRHLVDIQVVAPGMASSQGILLLKHGLGDLVDHFFIQILGAGQGGDDGYALRLLDAVYVGADGGTGIEGMGLDQGVGSGAVTISVVLASSTMAVLGRAEVAKAASTVPFCMAVEASEKLRYCTSKSS